MERKVAIRGKQKGKSPANLPSGSFIALGSKSGRSSGSSGDAAKPASVAPTSTAAPKREHVTTVNAPSSSSSSSSPSAPTTNVASGMAMYAFPPKKKTRIEVAGSSASSASMGSILLETPALALGPTAPFSSIPSGPLRKEIIRDDVWRKPAIDVPNSSIIRLIEEAGDSNPKQANAVLCGIVRKLHETRSKPPDPVLSLSLSVVAKTKGHLFMTRPVVEGLCSLLKRPELKLPGQKPHPAGLVIVCNSLMTAFADEKLWPELFYKVYLDDSLADRLWIDRSDCQSFVRNVITAFDSVQVHSVATIEKGAAGVGGSPPSNTIPTSGATGSDSTLTVPFTAYGRSSPHAVSEDDEQGRDSLRIDTSVGCIKTEPGTVDAGGGQAGTGPAGVGSECGTYAVMPRFSEFKAAIRDYTTNLLREWWSRRVDTSTTQLIRTMTVCCSYADVKMAATQRLDNWLQNPKLQKHACELLMGLALNCRNKLETDLEILNYLTKLRLKSKPVIQHYGICLREMFKLYPDNLETVLKLVVHNELSSNRAPHNMLIIGQAFQYNAKKAAEVLASLIVDLLYQREDYLRSIRTFLREMVRQALRFDFPFPSFCAAMFSDSHKECANVDATIKERIFDNMVELVCLSVFLGLAPSVREAHASLLRGEKRDPTIVRNFLNDVATVFQDSVLWLHELVPKTFVPTHADYVKGYYRALFLEKVDYYTGKDGFPSEQDRAFMLRLIAEVPIHQDVLLRILMAGYANELGMTAVDAIDLCETLVRRAASSSLHDDSSSVNTLKIEAEEFLELLFHTAEYKPPKTCDLPDSYKLPNLGVTALVWKSWNILLILAAFNPKVVGKLCWNSYLTGRYMMEMIMTKDFSFPPSSAVSQSMNADDIKNSDLQAAALEKQDVLLLENYLAKETITPANSHLLSTLMTLDPKGPARKPPVQVMEFLKQLSQELHLGVRLCKSRDPDFLLDIINRQGATQSLPWLVDMIDTHEGSIDILPVQCLCEFLLHQSELVNAKEDHQHTSSSGDEANVSVTSGGPVSILKSKSGMSDKSKMTKKAASAKLKRVHELEARLKSIIWSVNEEIEDVKAAEEILAYFFNRLQADTFHARQTALQGITMLLTNPPESAIVADTDMSMPVLFRNEFQWLFTYLVSLPLYRQLRSVIGYSLRQACLVETNREMLSAYIYFLGNYIADVNEEVISDLSKLVVNRTRLLAQLFDSATETDSSGDYDGVDDGDFRIVADDVYTIMLKFFGSYLEELWESTETEIPLTDNQDQVFVQWPDGKSAVLSIQVIYASTLLLLMKRDGVRSHPSDTDRSQYMAYQLLIDAWFPLSGSGDEDPADAPASKISATLLDTSEEAELFPSWLRHRMLQSNDDRISDAALSGMNLQQSIISLKSFGVSEKNIDRILKLLDATTDENAGLEREEFINLLACGDDYSSIKELRTVVNAHLIDGCCKNGNLFLTKLTDITSDEVDDGALNNDSMDVDNTEEGLLHEDLAGTTPTDAYSSSISDDLGITPDDVKDSLAGSIFCTDGEASERAMQRWSSLIGCLSREARFGDDQPRPFTERILIECLARFATVVSTSSEASGVATTGVEPGSTSGIHTTVCISHRNEDMWITLVRLLKRCLCGSTDAYSVQALEGLCQAVLKHSNSDSYLVKICSLPSRIKDVTGDEYEAKSSPTGKLSDAIAKNESFMSDLPQTLKETIAKAVRLRGHSEEEKAPLDGTLIQDAVTSLLQVLKTSSSSSSPGSDESTFSTTAICSAAISWLTLLDPELVQITKGFVKYPQLAAIFEKNGLDSQRQLLVALPHAAGIDTLRMVVSILLDEYSSSWDPVRVLDFITACVYLPKIWRGRERKAPRHAKLEDILGLTKCQAGSLLQYIIHEASSCADGVADESSDGHNGVAGTSSTVIHVSSTRKQQSLFLSRLEPLSGITVPPNCAQVYIQKRVPLLLRCCSNDETTAEVIRQLCQNISQKNKCMVSHIVLQEFYLQRPDVRKWVSDPSYLFAIRPTAQSSPCNIDTVCQRLLIELHSSCSTVGRAEEVLNAVNPALRKIATLHPTIFVRQMPLLASFLRGTTTKPMREMIRTRSYMVFILVALDYVELAEPAIFDRMYLANFQDIMESFFQFVEAHGLRNTRYVSVIDRCLALLLKYHRTCGEPASRFLQGYASLMQAISLRYPQLPSLKSLMTEVTLPLPPIAPLTSDSATAQTSTATSLMGAPDHDLGPSNARPPSPGRPEDVAELVLKLRSAACVHDIVSLLKMVDEECQSKQDLLQYFADPLEPLMTHWHSGVREAAFDLILRLLHYNPGCASRFVVSYLLCLESSNIEISKSALKFLPDFLAVCPEKAGILLERALISSITTLGGDGVHVMEKAMRVIHYCVDDPASATAAASMLETTGSQHEKKL